MPLPGRNRTDQKGVAVGWLIAVIVLLLLIGVVLYAIYNSNWRATEVNGSEVEHALASVKGASENAVTTSKVKTALALSKNVSASDINVDTNAGVVTLKGRVPSEEARRIAEEIARDTSGVKNVKNQLTVAGPETGPPPSDLEVRNRLEDLYAKEQTLKDDDIKTSVKDHVVTLEGAVGSTEEKRTAEARAWQMPGVKDVLNHLTVRRQPGSGQPGDELARRVEFELYSSRAFNLESIQIRSNDGVVTLQGQVRSQAEKLLAEKLAQDVNGVKSVRNDLHVVAPMTEPNPTETQPAE